MRILLVSDIHGNFPALRSVAEKEQYSWDLILNPGDSVVYAPFANETIQWLQRHQAVSIRGNTDQLVRRLLKGKDFAKPSKHEKRVMYTHTAENLSASSQTFLLKLPKEQTMNLEGWQVRLVHGSPADPEEFLFNDTPEARFRELAERCACDIVVCGHSHHQFHKEINGVHFINPGSVGRMFDGRPDAAYAVLTLTPGKISVALQRCPYPVAEVAAGIRASGLPEIYVAMYEQGRKLN